MSINIQHLLSLSILFAFPNFSSTMIAAKLIHECRYLFALQLVLIAVCLQLAQADQLQTIPTEQVQQSFWSKVTDVVQNTIAPELEYVRLLRRYQLWYKRYKAVQRPPMRDPRDALMEEYARVDEKLQAEACSPNQNNDVTLDHIHKALVIMIDNLERTVAELERGIVNIDQLEAFPESTLQDDHVKQAFDRIKTSVISKAKNFVATQSVNVVNLALYQGAESFIAQQQKLDPSSPIGCLEPIIKLLATTSIPVLTNYLRDYELRIATSAISSLHPMSYICKFG